MCIPLRNKARYASFFHTRFCRRRPGPSAKLRPQASAATRYHRIRLRVHLMIATHSWSGRHSSSSASRRMGTVKQGRDERWRWRNRNAKCGSAQQIHRCEKRSTIRAPPRREIIHLDRSSHPHICHRYSGDHGHKHPPNYCRSSKRCRSRSCDESRSPNHHECSRRRHTDRDRTHTRSLIPPRDHGARSWWPFWASWRWLQWTVHEQWALLPGASWVKAGPEPWAHSSGESSWPQGWPEPRLESSSPSLNATIYGGHDVDVDY